MAEYRVPSINKVMMTGNLTADPDLRYMPDGRAVCNFQIASTKRRYKNKTTGEWVDAPPTFVRVVTWGATAEGLGERLRKGNAVFVEGTLESRSWETPEGQKRSTIEIRAMRVQNLMKLPRAQEGVVEDEEVDEKEAANKETDKEGLPF
jgi:single-strand DNA-binding protein